MKKKIDILGRKVPVLAVMMVLLVIGTASAALIANYATLTGDVTVTNHISVVGDGGTTLLDMGDGTGGFTITNTDSVGIDVEAVTTLYLNLPVDPTPQQLIDCEVTDVTGITITVNGFTLLYSELEGAYNTLTITATGGTGTDPFVPGITDVPVTFVAVPGVVTGDYTIQVAVNPPATP